MKIIIKNCNNLDIANISIFENSLNIKYAVNGAGKSTIAQAILCFVNDKLNGKVTINELKPFKYLNQEGNNPEVVGADQIKSIKVFDEKYINEFVFLPSELLKGSFDIFIRDENYKKGMKEIDDLVDILRNTLAEDKDLDNLINDFNELSGSFGKPTKSGIHGGSIISKALKNGNKIVNIPDGLQGYKDYIKNENNFRWIKWQIDGKSYLGISDNCPYCTNNIKEKNSTISRVGEVYDSKTIENLNMLVGVFQRLNQYFSEDTKNNIDKFIKNVDGYTDDQVTYLMEVKQQIDRLKEKFINVKKLGFISLKDVDKLIEGLKAHCIDINLFYHLNSDNTKEKVEIVNDSIDKLIKKAGKLQGNINRQKKLIEKLVKSNKNEINGFLKNAGYQYHVDIIGNENGEYKLILIHNDIRDEVNNVKTHLSFGERNAFSLVLFMYDALKSVPDLIVLDDPISSFDKNKKYAIVEMLFRREKCFRGKTVLLLTHDFEPIVDMVYHHSDKFKPPSAVFLENKHGELCEKEILKSDIKTFIDINNENIKGNNNEINKLIYLRRLYEITNEKGCSYQLISNLLHKREVPITKNNGDRPMNDEEVKNGTLEIQKEIPNFNYRKYLSLVKDNHFMKELYLSTKNNYEKLHIYRIIYDDKPAEMDSEIIQKFINEAFHIENDYIYQLNPCKYQLVPQYVIDECDKYVQLL